MSLVTASSGNTAATISPISTALDPRFCDRSFSLDLKNYLVRFTQSVYRIDAANRSLGPAILRLRTAFRLRDSSTGALRRQWLRKKVPGARGQTKPMCLLRDDVEPTVRQKYAASYAPSGSVDNHAAIQQELQSTLVSQLVEFGMQDPACKKYPGILAIELDGSLQAITWEIGPRGGFTTVQRHQDRGSATTIPYRLRRQMERQKENADRAAIALPALRRNLHSIS